MLKIAVIGLGDISNIHLPVIQANPNVSLVAVCDIDERQRDVVPDATFYTNYEEMLAKEKLDCIHICLPHYLHYEATKACVKKGVHVLQEKPLALNLEESLALLRLEEEHKDVKICICFQNRYNETFEKLREIVASGKYGEVKGIKALVTWFRQKSYYDSKAWRAKMKYAGGGVMINQSIHTLDLMQLLGGEMESIRGSIDHLADFDIEVEDTATAKIKFSSGASGLFFATVVNADNSSVEFQVLFEKAKFTIKDSVLTKVNEHGQKVPIIEDAKASGTKFYYGASHAKLIHHFYNCIENNTSDYVNVKEALTSMKMIDAIRKSSESKRAVQLSAQKV